MKMPCKTFENPVNIPRIYSQDFHAFYFIVIRIYYGAWNLHKSETIELWGLYVINNTNK